jgi:hypothetical protein
MGVGMFRGVTTRTNYEKTHRKTRRGIVRTDQAAHAAIGRALGVDRCGVNLFTMDNFHRWSPVSSASHYTTTGHGKTGELASSV